MFPTATLQYLPPGPAGTRATLQAMAGMVRDYRKNMTVRTLALRIANTVPGHKNFNAVAATLCQWVQAHINYVRDVRDVETVQTPLVTIRLGAGDCDDQATLLATMLESIGYTTRFRAIKLATGGEFEHVVSEYLDDESGHGSRWVPLETTEPWRPGDFPVASAGDMYQEV